MARDYRLVPQDVPPIVKVTLYERILEEFLASKHTSVRVDVPKKKPSTIHQSLLKAKKANERFDGLAVVRRRDTIYLRRK